MSDTLKDAALEYHRTPTPGKLAVTPTKPLSTQRDLALAYSPGVAAACEAIVADPAEASTLTARGNLVAVVTNGTAVLGLGAIGPLAAKPVMEGKAVLFKKFAGIDVFDIEVAETDPDRFVDVVAALEPTFGGINLEDIKAPECFEIEEKLRARMNIPVFHDDQHGTAIIVAAAILNGLRIVGKDIGAAKLVVSGAGAAALACLDLLVNMGVRRENVWVSDIAGVVYEGRAELMDPRKARYAQPTAARTLAEVIDGADVFLGLSAPRVLKPEMCARMAPDPLILALANPTPEIMPDEARAVRPDAIVATGRSDFPNQVNNVLCFPFIFRGALDVGATTINEEMKIAAVQAIADLAMAEQSDVVASAYGDQPVGFGRDYVIPKPFDPRLIVQIAPAVAQAAMDSGVATRPIDDMDAYRERLSQYVYRSGLVMRPVFLKARQDRKRIVYAEGEDERVLRAVQTVLDEQVARPVLVGRREVVARRIEKLGLRFRLDRQVELCDPQDDPRYPEYWGLYHQLLAREGIAPDLAKLLVRTNPTIISALMVRRGEADALLCGTYGRYQVHLGHLVGILGRARDVETPAAVSVLVGQRGMLFIADTHVNPEPSVEDLCDMTLMAADAVRRFGIVPKVALVSHSDFGTFDTPSSRKMRTALQEIRRRAPDLEVEGEMNADTALVQEIRDRLFPDAGLKGAANLLIMPDLDAGNIAYNLLKIAGDQQRIGPLLLGTAYPAHILTPTVTARGIFNMTAIAAVDAQTHAAAREPAGAGAPA